MVYWRGYWDLAWFARFYFPEYCRLPFSRMHRELFELLEGGATDRGRRICIAAPRGHAKTTISLTIQIVHALCYGYEPYIVIMAQNQRESQARVKGILDIIRTNERLKQVFGDLAPPKGMGSKNQFVARNNALVKAVSWGQSIRGMNHQGHRPSLIILDDVETLEGVQNPEQREKYREQFKKDVLQAGDVTNTLNVVVIGTCLHDDGLINHLLCHAGWTVRKYQAVEAFATNTQLWQDWRTILNDRTNPDRLTDARAFYDANKTAMLEGSHVLWPEGESYERLMCIREFEGNAAFQSEKQNEPYDAERSLFNPDTFATFTWDKVNRILTLSNRRVGLSELHTIYAFWDPAVGNDDSSDYAAIVVAGKDAHGYVYVLDAWLGKEKPHQQLGAAVSLYKKWDFSQLGVEGNGFQALVVREARDRFNALGEGCRVLKAKSTSNKELRIASLEPMVNNGSLIFRQNINPLLFDQLKYFPTATHDDGPDALAGVVKSLSNKIDPSQPLQRRRARRRR